MLRFSNSDAILYEAMEELFRNWELTASGWRDQARQEFEKRYIDELRPAVKGACNAMKSIYSLLGKVKRDCT